MNKQERISTLLDIYERFGDKAQKALEFVNNNIEEKMILAPSAPIVESEKYISSGVYYILKDGRYFSRIAGCLRDEVSSIGIAHDGHYFSVPLDWNYGKSHLLEKYKYPEDEYCQKEIEAIIDWDFVKHTNHLKELGLSINLKEGHYLSTMPVFGAMYKNRKHLNVALKYVGAEEIDFSEDFWFAQRHTEIYTWFFNGNYSNLYNSCQRYEYRCGAVSLWEPK